MCNCRPIRHTTCASTLATCFFCMRLQCGSFDSKSIHALSTLMISASASTVCSKNLKWRVAWHKWNSWPASLVNMLIPFLFLCIYFLYCLKIVSLGSDVQRAGTKVTARGRVTTATGKEALGGMLDAQVAVMQAEGVPSATRSKNKGNKAKTAKTAKSGSEENVKQLQRDIKGYLVSKSHVGNRTWTIPWHGLIPPSLFSQGCVTRAPKPASLPSKWRSWKSSTKRCKS